MADIERKPIEAGVLQRISQGLSYVIRGVTPNTWMSPSQPVLPVAQEAAGRQNDYPVGQNLNYLQRTTAGASVAGVSFVQLRALAQNYDLLRLAIETRKDQISKLNWVIKPKDRKNKNADDAIKIITNFLAYPDKINNFDSWIRQIVEDVLVIDAPAIYPRMTNGNKLYSLELIDGATITRLIDSSGRPPLAPSPAFQQILKGVPAVDYTIDEIIYKPRNLRTNTLYGYSPVEQIIMTINIAMRRQLSQLQYYTEGNIPDAFITVPESWSAPQIAQYQDWFDSVLAGNTGQRRKAKFIAHGSEIHETRENPLKDDYDEWLVRIICFAFSITPQALTKQMNRASAQTQQESAEDEGLEPLKKYICTLINFIIFKYFGNQDVEFTWQEEVEQDAFKQAQLNDLYIKNGSKSVDEVRAELGLDAIGMSNAVYGSSGVEFVKDLIDPAYQENKLQMQQASQASLQPSKDDTKKIEKREKKKPVLY